MYNTSDIARIIQADARLVQDMPVTQLLLDSRKIVAPASSLFFALPGFRRDGHDFIPALYRNGVRNFVISRDIDTGLYPEANLLRVKDSLAALQELAAYHRGRFSIPVIGITGSNGKTIVKEWLYQLLHPEYHIVRSPKSYNSQIGVPLSIWQMNSHHTLALFEAGISRPGEMEKLEKMIRPSIGVFTNIGEAHSEGFASREQKEKEKRILFSRAEEVSGLQVIRKERSGSSTRITARDPRRPGREISIEIPFTDEAAAANAITCWQLMLHLGYEEDTIRGRMLQLVPVDMRLELKKGINHCNVINDSYSVDLSSLEIALNFLVQQSPGIPRTVILSDFLQSAIPDDQLYAQVLEALKKHEVGRLIGIGERISAALSRQPGLNFRLELYPSTTEFLQQFRSSAFKEEAILVKGARVFQFEQIVQQLEQKVHQTVLEINLNAIIHNLKAYQAALHPATKVMAMVKAFAYGSGGAEIAGILQYHKVEYLGVAYADEGVELRKAGISLPVMVMNPEENAFDTIVSHNLEPELYSFEIMKAFDLFLQKEGLQQYPVHIEVETGMNRLGFAAEEVRALGEYLISTSSFNVQSVFSHLAASEEAVQDSFTGQQFEKFGEAVRQLKSLLGYPFLTHIANSAAAIRHPKLQLDMVRLGIGLYGVDSAGSGQLALETVATLKSTVAQLKFLKAGDSVSYNRRGRVERDAVIATIRLGYADGYPRRLGNGKGRVLINGKLAPVIGTVCMDMFMVDVTGIAGIKEGDEVIVFGKDLPVQQLAEWADTIPYEILTGVSQRVKRVYFEE
ncbi:MAG: alanine racemase [Sphingobacteriales bacterium]|nr:alanine racemase [Sphingobacteriales bacterium]